MNNIEFDAYLTNVFKLTRSIVIKLEKVASIENKVLIEAGFPVSSDKRTWRYYQNMNGDYHSSDRLMYVKSVDTDEMIEFTKDNLLIHLGTAREYRSGGELSQRLNTTYPDQTELIKGILDPIPYEISIPAQDYKILKYNKDLVLWNEDQLIPQLQNWIYQDPSKLFNNDYTVTDDLMGPIAVIKLYADIIKAILTIRFEAIGTRYAHDFYIWSHIDSYGAFSPYKNSLNNKQIMWLYRNIAWVKNNPGQQYTFDKLVTNLLTQANVPIAKYDMVENTETQLTDLTPTPLYRRLYLNLQEDYGRAASFIDTSALIQKQQNQAKENLDQSTTYYNDALLEGKFSVHSELPTKVLESSMSDYTNRHISTLMSTVYHEWIYLTGKGIYDGKVMAVDPKTGKSVRMGVGDAYHIWLYLIGVSSGQVLVDIQPAYYQNVMKLKHPTVDEMIDIGGKAFVTPTMARGMLDHWVGIEIFIAPEQLMEYSFQVYESQWNLTKISSIYYDLNMRARLKNTASLMAESGFTKLTEFSNYKDLIASYELDFSQYTQDEARNFAWDIFKRVTGWDSNAHPSTRTKQSDLIDMMSMLSSYTIQIIKEMDDGIGLTEIKNETFIGDPRWTGKGNELDGDFSNAKLGNKGHIDPILASESLTNLYVKERLTSTMGSSSTARLNNNDHVKPIDIYKDVRSYAVRMQDTSYFKAVVTE